MTGSVALFFDFVLSDFVLSENFLFAHRLELDSDYYSVVLKVLNVFNLQRCFSARCSSKSLVGVMAVASSAFNDDVPDLPWNLSTRLRY